MARVTVEIPYRNVEGRELIIDAMVRYLGWSRQRCGEWIDQQTSAGTGDYIGSPHIAGNSEQFIPITLILPDDMVAEAQQDTSARIGRLSPEVREFLFGDAEPSGDIDDGDIDDIRRAIEIAERMRPEERAEINSDGTREIVLVPSTFTQILEAKVREIQERSVRALSEIEDFDPAPAVTSDTEGHLAAIEAMLRSDIASEGRRGALEAQQERLQAVVDARVAEAADLPIPTVPDLSEQDAALLEQMRNVPGLGDQAVDASQLQLGMASFMTGIVRGYAIELPEGGHEIQGFEEPRHYAEAYAGYLQGLCEGIASGIGGIVSAADTSVSAVLAAGGLSIDMLTGGWDNFMREHGEEIDAAIATASCISIAVREFEAEFRASPAAVGGELGTVFGRMLANQVDEFAGVPAHEKGRRIGTVVGAVLFEIIGELILAAATGGAAPAARAGTAAVQAAQAGTRGARFAGALRRLLNTAPIIQRFLRRMNRAGDVAEAVPTPPASALDEMSEVADAAGDAGRRLDDGPPRARADGPNADADAAGRANETPEERRSREAREVEEEIERRASGEPHPDLAIDPRMSAEMAQRVREEFLLRLRDYARQNPVTAFLFLDQVIFEGILARLLQQIARLRSQPGSWQSYAAFIGEFLAREGPGLSRRATRIWEQYRDRRRALEAMREAMSEGLDQIPEPPPPGAVGYPDILEGRRGRGSSNAPSATEAPRSAPRVRARVEAPVEAPPRRRSAGAPAQGGSGSERARPINSQSESETPDEIEVDVSEFDEGPARRPSDTPVEPSAERRGQADSREDRQEEALPGRESQVDAEEEIPASSPVRARVEVEDDAPPPPPRDSDPDSVYEEVPADEAAPARRQRRPEDD